MDGEKLEVEVRADIKGVDRDMAAAGKAIKGLGDASDAAAKQAENHAKKVEDLKRASTDIGKSMLIAGAAVGAGVAMAVVEFAKYGKAASNYRAVSGATASEMAKLKTASMQIGEAFGFSAVEATDAATALNKAGVSTADVLGGALSGALTLAATDTIEVADAAETAAIAMTQFKLQGKDVPHIVDLLAAGAGQAVGDVKDLSWGLRQSGLVASQFGLSVDETVGTLSAFASAGLIGSDAGTSFKQMLLSLASPSGVAAKKMAELGLHAYDTGGKFIGIERLAGELQRTMGGLSQESRNAALSIIFGQDAIRSSAVLYELGADGIADWIDKVDQTGYASKIAAEKLNNLNGDWKKLTVTVQNGLIDIGGSSDSFLRPLVQGMTDAVRAFRDLPEPVKGGMLAVAGLTAGALLLGGALLTGIPKIVEFKESWDKLSAANSKHTGTLGKIAEGVALVTAAYGAAIVAAKMFDAALDHDKTKGSSEITNALTGTANNPSKIASGLDKSFSGTFTSRNPNLQNGLSDVKDFSGALRRIYQATPEESLHDWSGDMLMQDGAGGKKARAQFAELDKSMSNMASSGNTADATATFDEMRKKAEALKVPVGDLIKLLPNYTDAMVGVATQNGLTNLSEEEKAKVLAGTSDKLAAAQGATSAAAQTQEQAKIETQKWSEALESIGVSIDGAINSVSKFTDYLVQAGLLTLSSRDATAQYEDAVDGLKDKVDKIMETSEKFGGTLTSNRKDFDLTTKAGRDANDVFADMIQKGLGAATAMAKNGDSQPAVQAQLVKTYESAKQAAIGFGMGEKAADALVRQVLHIPPNVNIKTWMSDEARRKAAETKLAMDAINNKTVHTYTVEHVIKSIETQVKGGGSADNPSDTALRPGSLSRKAAGGAVYGVGPKGIDSEPHLLAPGEHVLTASEVDKMGGQQAVYAMRAAIRSGVGYSTAIRTAPAAGIDYGKLAAAVSSAGTTYQFTVPDKATAQDFFAEAKHQTQVKSRGGRN